MTAIDAMDNRFTLNPFALVSENDEGFLIHTTGQMQVRFAKRDRPFIDMIMSGEPLEKSRITRYLAQNRFAELRRKRVLVEGNVPPLEGRYSRQLGFFSLISEDHTRYQDILQKADVLLLGAGGIGSHVLWNLAAMGVRRVTVVDFDVVEETNLNRQLMYSHDDIGKSKVHVLCSKIARFNPEIEITPVEAKIETPADVERLMPGKTLVIKAIDTPEQSTAWVNELCVKYQIPFLTGGFLDYVGVIGPMYIPGKSLCAACLGLGDVKRLKGTGATFGPLTTTVSSLMSMFAFKIIIGQTGNIANKLHMFNTVTDTWESVPVTAAAPCRVCGHVPPPRTAAAAPTGDAAKAWTYRGAIALVMLIATLIRAANHDQYIGILVFCILVLSVPVIDLLFAGRPPEARRQIFAISCIYCLTGLVITTVQNWSTTYAVVGTGFNAFFGIAQQICLAIVQTAIAISFLFFILNGFMWAVRAVMHKGAEWIA